MAIEGKCRQARFFVVHSPKTLDFGTVVQLGLILTALYIVNSPKFFFILGPCKWELFWQLFTTFLSLSHTLPSLSPTPPLETMAISLLRLEGTESHLFYLDKRWNDPRWQMEYATKPKAQHWSMVAEQATDCIHAGSIFASSDSCAEEERRHGDALWLLQMH